jgi:hypothetical protein
MVNLETVGGSIIEAHLRPSDQWPDLYGVQITFHEDRDPPSHAMPPGGFRLAIVNGWNLEAGLAARNQLRTYFLRALQTRSIAPAGGDHGSRLIASGAVHRFVPSDARAQYAARSGPPIPGAPSDTAIVP